MIKFIIILCIILVIALLYGKTQSKKYFDDIEYGVYWFFRPGCPHCDNMVNDWYNMKKMISSYEYNIIEIDTSLDINNLICDKFNVSSVPYIVKIGDLGKEVYKGPRTASSIRDWIVKKTN